MNSIYNVKRMQNATGYMYVYHAASPIDYLLFSLQYMGLYVFNWPISVPGDL